MPVMPSTIRFSLSLVARNPKSSHVISSKKRPFNEGLHVPLVKKSPQVAVGPSPMVHAPFAGPHPIEVIPSPMTTETSTFKLGFIFTFHVE